MNGERPTGYWWHKQVSVPEVSESACGTARSVGVKT